MKKLFLVLVCVLILLTTSCGNKLTIYTEINYEQYIDKIKNNNTFPLVIGSSNCSACALFEGTMKSFIKENQIEVFIIDISKLSEEEYNTLKSQTSFDGTPTTIFFESGKITSYYNRIDGAVGISKVKEYFKNNNYID